LLAGGPARFDNRGGSMLRFLWGALTVACLVASLLFYKSYRQTHERLFALFAAAFLVLSSNWGVLGLWNPSNESSHLVYLLRLFAFALILAGILDKNRRRS
jgi:hypothetical protein